MLAGIAQGASQSVVPVWCASRVCSGVVVASPWLQLLFAAGPMRTVAQGQTVVAAPVVVVAAVAVSTLVFAVAVRAAVAY